MEEEKIPKFGPFHRIQSPTQSNEVADLQVKSQEMWGRPRRGSDIPQVQAYTGPLPKNAKGIEFVTHVKPDDSLPPGQARWTGPRQGVTIKDEFCRISVHITRNTQSQPQASESAKEEESALMVA